MNSMDYDVVIVGGGAAGFFTAINLAKARPDLRVVILEKAKDVLQKVRISGGGRCNVTHAEFDPRTLATYYPRGEKELLGPFHRFMTGDTVAWFEDEGIDLKIEEDGRMFPISDSSQTIIDCFLELTERLGIAIHNQQNFLGFKKDGQRFAIRTQQGQYTAAKLVVCAGSSKKIWSLMALHGHTIVPPVPSLFTFNIKEPELIKLQGISQFAEVQLLDDKARPWLSQDGSVLITHWGMSGPGVLKLSAVAARELNQVDYNFKIRLNWLPANDQADVFEVLKKTRIQRARQQLSKAAPFDMSKRLWKYLCNRSGIAIETIWADQSNENLQRLSATLCSDQYDVTGKSTFKEEFVTAGGVELSEINFKRFESKIVQDLYLAGEVINIDALTGGFNFQNAWTGGYIIAEAIAEST